MSLKEHVIHLEQRLDSVNRRIKESKDAVVTLNAQIAAEAVKLDQLQVSKLETEAAIEALKNLQKEGSKDDSSQSKKTPSKRRTSSSNY